MLLRSTTLGGSRRLTAIEASPDAHIIPVCITDEVAFGKLSYKCFRMTRWERQSERLLREFNWQDLAGILWDDLPIH
jgi:hypothetical protein